MTAPRKPRPRTRPLHDHMLGLPCTSDCVVPSSDETATSTRVSTLPPAFFLLEEISNRVERVNGRLSARFSDGHWEVRLVYYRDRPRGQWPMAADDSTLWTLAVGRGKILLEALQLCLEEAEAREASDSRPTPATPGSTPAQILPPEVPEQGDPHAQEPPFSASEERAKPRRIMLDKPEDYYSETED